MIDFPRIQAFCEVADCLSFTEAANRLYTSQSSLSKAIASLERHFGFNLFIRSNRNVTLTPAGEYLHNCFKQTLTDMHRNVAHAREISEGKHGSLRIGIIGIGNVDKEVSSIFLEFRKSHPTYDIEFVTVTAKETHGFLISQKIDAVIINQQEIPLLMDCDYRTILSSNLVAIARNDHPLFTTHANPELLSLKDIGFVIISHNTSPYSYEMTLKVCEANGFFPIIKIVAESAFGLMMTVAATDYIAISNERDSSGNDALRQIPVNHPFTEKTVLAWNRNSFSSALYKLIEFIDEINK